MRFNVLGNLTVSMDGVAVPVRSAKQRTLLALLALSAGQPVTTATIMDELWPEQEQRASSVTLRTHIFQLRRTFNDAGRRDAETLHAVSGGYQLVDAEARVDADDFASLAASGHRALKVGDYRNAAARFGDALAVWRGPVLADVARGPRLEAAARQLEEAKLLAHGHEADIMLRLGLHRESLPDLAGLVQEYPLDEGMAARYMLALYHCDRRADALAHFQRLRRRLDKDLGLGPSRRLQEIHSAILTAQVSIELAVPQPA